MRKFLQCTLKAHVQFSRFLFRFFLVFAGFVLCTFLPSPFFCFEYSGFVRQRTISDTFNSFTLTSFSSLSKPLVLTLKLNFFCYFCHLAYLIQTTVAAIQHRAFVYHFFLS